VAAAKVLAIVMAASRPMQKVLVMLIVRSTELAEQAA
jgi:hypothetical protein